MTASIVLLTSVVPGARAGLSPNASAVLRLQMIQDGGTTEGTCVLLQVPCDAVKAGELDVPLALGPRETAVDATAAFLNPQSLRLGDLTVLTLDDRSVKLRFTLTGVPPPAFPAPCPQGQALVTVRLNLVVLPRQ